MQVLSTKIAFASRMLLNDSFVGEGKCLLHGVIVVNGVVVRYSVVLFYTDVGNGVAVFSGHLFDEAVLSVMVHRFNMGIRKPFFVGTSRMESVSRVRVPLTVMISFSFSRQASCIVVKHGSCSAGWVLS